MRRAARVWSAWVCLLAMSSAVAACSSSPSQDAGDVIATDARPPDSLTLDALLPDALAPDDRADVPPPVDADPGDATDAASDAGPPTPTTIGGVTVTLTAGVQPVPVPFPTWRGARVAVSPSATGTTYYVDGAVAASGNGRSVATAFKTIGEAVAVVAAGDTVLIRRGRYRELVDLSGASGTSGHPITFGAYGDGEVIVEHSLAVSAWTRVSAGSSVWRTTVARGTVDAVVVNGVPLARRRTTAVPPVAGRGEWAASGTTLYADMGAATPDTADVFVVAYDHGDSTIYLGAAAWINVIGLTVRGSGWAGIWSYADGAAGGHNVNVAYCDIQFNDGAGLVFTGGNDNAALYNRVLHNVLHNWPFCSNDYCVAGGGWPGALGWAYEANPVARGNVVYLNAGEGIISYGHGTANGMPSGNTLFEQNVSFDNWSMNSYVDNQPRHVIRRNLFFRHAPDPAWMWDPTDRYSMEKFRTCLSLADEAGSGAPEGTAALSDVRVYDNLLLGCRTGILDYNESTTGHGMRNDLIANNTIVMDASSYTQENIAGLSIGDNGSANVGTIVVNNVVYRPSCPATGCGLVIAQGPARLAGIVFRHNLYFAVGAGAGANSLFQTNVATSPVARGFADWQSYQGQDADSVYGDPLFTDAAHLAPFTDPFDVTRAALRAGSPGLGLGLPQTPTFTDDFAGATRGASWTVGAIQ